MNPSTMASMAKVFSFSLFAFCTFAWVLSIVTMFIAILSSSEFFKTVFIAFSIFTSFVACMLTLPAIFLQELIDRIAKEREDEFSFTPKFYSSDDSYIDIDAEKQQIEEIYPMTE
jgi:hypothetical protein